MVGEKGVEMVGVNYLVGLRDIYGLLFLLCVCLFVDIPSLKSSCFSLLYSFLQCVSNSLGSFFSASFSYSYTYGFECVLPVQRTEELTI